MSHAEAFQLSMTAAEMYENKFVPGLFDAWAPVLVQAAGVKPGHTVLDVACGTGVVARHAADRLKGRGRVIGIDNNAAMLTVARRRRADIEWRQADATGLPFPDASVDVTLCQAALMFFPDPRAALREMTRVTSPAGTVAIQVWSGISEQVGWAPFYDVLRRIVGSSAVDVVATYWRLGNLNELVTLCGEADLDIQHTLTRQDDASFDSVDDFLATEVLGTPLQERINQAVYSEIVEQTRGVLAPFTARNGRLHLPIKGHILVAQPR